MNLINLTPHEINIYDNDKTTLLRSIPSSGIARVSVARHQSTTINGIPVFVSRYSNTTGLPPVNNDDFFIVSLVVKNANNHRTDLLSPGELLRNDQGQPIGCVGLDN